jgi:hypothetical protein
LAILALAVAMILTPFTGLLMATVGLAALEAKGLLPAMGTAITLAAITVAAKIKHRAAGRKVAHPLTKDGGARCRHRLGGSTGQPAPIMKG